MNSRREISVLLPVSLAVAIFVIVAMFSSQASGLAYCSQHQCDEGAKCVPKLWVCDGDPDCDDLSDEKDCGQNKTSCDSGDPDNPDFLCFDKKHCIPERWTCDGEFDCQDRSDELNCHNITCDFEHMSCGKGLPCVHKTFLCDGHKDCSNGYDELKSACQLKVCNENEFNCSSGHQCISSRWRCDGDTDCTDGSDERNCPKITCTPGQFQCTDTQCIPQEWRCDGKFDCADSSDELACAVSSQPETHCAARDFMCKVSAECIPEHWKCDLDRDCEDGSDEDDCPTVTCLPDQFQCRSGGNCIPHMWECDGMIQCEDGSDEANCFNRPCDPVIEFDCNSVYPTVNGTSPPGRHCIPIEQLCDRRNDCGLNEDEEKICERNHTSSCRVNNGGCQQRCLERPEAPVCLCNEGYVLASDKTTCRDIDECSVENHPCSHICENTKGSFKCHCREGYELDISNHVECYAKGTEPMLLFSNRHDIREFHVRSLRYRPVIEGLRGARALDYDTRSRTVFWCDASWKNISRAMMSKDLQSVVRQDVIVSGIREPEGLAYDWVHNNLYFTDNSQGRIEVVSVGNLSEPSTMTRWRHTLHEGLNSPKAIVIDPRENKRHVYWTEVGESARIMRSAMDGSNKVAVVPAGPHIVQPLGLALDMESDTLFWVDAKLHVLEMLNLTSQATSIVFTSAIHLRHPFSLAVFEDYVYWTDWQTDSILKRNKFNSSLLAQVTRVATLLSSPTDVKVFHELTQPMTQNVCADKKCSHLCLPTGDRSRPYRCACPTTSEDQPNVKVTYTLVGGTTCVLGGAPSITPTPNSPTSSVTQTSTAVNGSLAGEAGNQTAIESSSSTGVALGVCGVLLFILVAIFCYILLRRYRQRNRKTMNFDNPMYRKRAGDEFSIDKNLQPIDNRISQQLMEPLANSSTEHLATVNS